MNQVDLCEDHQQPLVFFDDKSQKFLCLNCLQVTFQFQSISEFRQKQIDNRFKTSEQFLKLLKQLQEDLELHKQQILQSIEQFLRNVSKFIKTTEEKQAILKDEFYQQSIYQCKLQKANSLNFQNILVEVRNKLQSEMNALIGVSKLDKLAETMNNLNSICDGSESQANPINLEQMEKKNNNRNQIQYNLFADKKFDYQLIQETTYKQDQQTFALSFNKDSSLMIANCDKLIKLFEFKQDKLKEIQQLNGHTTRVFCILIMNKTNHFISGSEDGVMIIWEQNQNSQWQSKQVLKAHTDIILGITTNQNEDMLISGSHDNTIKFWQRENNTWNSKQSIQCSNIVWSISLSNNEDKLIASINDKYILVITLQGKEWIINQQISVEQCGYRLCFINQNQFIFQPHDRQYCLIFNFDLKEQKYKQEIEIKYQNKGSDCWALSPIRNITQMGLILVKNDEYIHLIKRSQDGKFTVEQSIHFGTCHLFCGISGDGRYIASWDNKSKEIQTRKLKE